MYLVTPFRRITHHLTVGKEKKTHFEMHSAWISLNFEQHWVQKKLTGVTSSLFIFFRCKVWWRCISIGVSGGEGGEGDR